MPRAPRASAIRKDAATGKMASARSKTALPMCSQAMSTWKTSGMTPQVAAVLGKCRSIAYQKNRASGARAAGNEARAQHWEANAARGLTMKERASKAKEIRAQRAAKAADQKDRVQKVRERTPGSLPVRPHLMYVEDARIILHKQGMPNDFLDTNVGGKTHRQRMEMHRQMGLTPEQSAKELEPFLEAAKNPNYMRRENWKAIQELGHQRHQEYLKSRQLPGPQATVKAAGRGTDERLTRARQIRDERAKDHWGSANALRTKNRPLGYERREAERVSNKIKRNTKNVALLKDYLASGGQVVVPSYTKPILWNNPEHVAGVDHLGNITGLDRGRAAKKVGLTSDQARHVLRGPRLARAQQLRAQRAARKPAAAATPTLRQQVDAKRTARGLAPEARKELAGVKREAANLIRDTQVKIGSRAYSNWSYSPEKYAAQATAERTRAAQSTMRSQVNRAPTAADARVILDVLKRHKAGVADRAKSYTAAESRTASSMVVGPARFNVARNEKRIRTAEKRQAELNDFQGGLENAVSRAMKREAPTAQRLTRIAELRKRNETRKAKIKQAEDEAFRQSVYAAHGIEQYKAATKEERVAALKTHSAEAKRREAMRKTLNDRIKRLKSAEGELKKQTRVYRAL